MRLRDGTPVRIRAVRPDDKERVRVAFEHLSAQTIYRRLFHPKSALTSEDLRILTEPDMHDQVTLVVTVDEPAGERLVGLGQFVRVAHDADQAEFGLTVADDYQHRGAGTLLLQQLVEIARSNGVRELIGLVLDENRDMLELLEHVDLSMRRTFEDGAHRVALSLSPRSRHRDAKAMFR